MRDYHLRNSKNYHLRFLEVYLSQQTTEQPLSKNPKVKLEYTFFFNFKCFQKIKKVDNQTSKMSYSRIFVVFGLLYFKY